MPQWWLIRSSYAIPVGKVEMDVLSADWALANAHKSTIFKYSLPKFIDLRLAFLNFDAGFCVCLLFLAIENTFGCW